MMRPRFKTFFIWCYRKAKADNVPNDNITKAIKDEHEDKDSALISELFMNDIEYDELQ